MKSMLVRNQQHRRYYILLKPVDEGGEFGEAREFASLPDLCFKGRSRDTRITGVRVKASAAEIVVACPW